MNNVNSIYSLQKYCTLCGWLKHMPPKLMRTNTHNQMHIYKTSRTCSVMWCMPYTVWMTKPHSWPGAHTRSRVDQLDGTNLTPSARHVLHHPSSPVGWWCMYPLSCIMQKVYSVPCIHCTIFCTIAHRLARAPVLHFLSMIQYYMILCIIKYYTR